MLLKQLLRAISSRMTFEVSCVRVRILKTTPFDRQQGCGTNLIEGIGSGWARIRSAWWDGTVTNPNGAPTTQIGGGVIGVNSIAHKRLDRIGNLQGVPKRMPRSLQPTTLNHKP